MHDDTTIMGPAAPASRMVCRGCGHVVPDDTGYPFRCPAAVPGDDIDHVLARELLPEAVKDREELRAIFLDADPNPFRRYRRLFHSYHVGRRYGLGDDDYLGIVDRLDDAVAEVDGSGFRVTPFGECEELTRLLGFEDRGGVWTKNETGNVSGSHKARHLMGLMIWLEVAERVGLIPRDDRPPLAIASCGNAALAAAVVARAARRPLQVYVPPHANPHVMDRLAALGAKLMPCPRRDEPGDPCYLRFREAVEAGALPFTVQGPENGLVIEGCETLAYEMISFMIRDRLSLDQVYVQVGGGALASAVIQGFEEAISASLIPRLPKLVTVQTRGAFPLQRAYRALVERIVAGQTKSAEGEIAFPPAPAARAARILDVVPRAAVDRWVDFAAHHRAEFMWPWELPPHSVAEGILDDETYDWLAVVRGMLISGGIPLVVEESTLVRAHELTHRCAEVPADHTGASGVAGLLHMKDTGAVSAHDRVAVLLTGQERG